jgi:hypothetical protein
MTGEDMMMLSAMAALGALGRRLVVEVEKAT